MICRALKLLVLLASLPALQTTAVFAVSLPPQVSVTLVWNPSPGPGVAGYRVYEGGASQTYTNKLDVGNTTTTLCNLVTGATYFFTMTAYDTDGLESPFSREISYTVPATAALAKLHLSLLQGKQAQLSGTAPIGYEYQILAGSSPGGTNWSAIGSVTASTNGAFLFIDSGTATNALRCYRLRQTYP